ncbi:MAG TPA: class I SAM-dependent methyltransferase [Vicinamibacterales bacterium]|nr:class I SAM-dependent methyltransferase [Vicinamibacterales bacterium]
MTIARFDFQRACVENALAEDGIILNVGCNNDPGAIKFLDVRRVINCDLHAEIMGVPHVADMLFDAARDRWPFEDGTVSLVVFGDILEHLSEDDIRAALTEARRVSRGVCITVPEDHRPEVLDHNGHSYKHPRGAVHQTIVTEELLRRALQDAGWTVSDWQVVEYDDGRFWGERTMGHFVEAR